jgi:hypothetical protein
MTPKRVIFYLRASDPVKSSVTITGREDILIVCNMPRDGEQCETFYAERVTP